jgi:hypothetical protein
MYASVRKYRAEPGDVAEIMRRIDEKFAPSLEVMDGFLAYQVIDTGDGVVFTVTCCRDSEAAERSVEAAGEFVRDELTDLEIERLDVANGEVSVSRAVSDMLEPAHV